MDSLMEAKREALELKIRRLGGDDCWPIVKTSYGSIRIDGIPGDDQPRSGAAAGELYALRMLERKLGEMESTP